jgi:hypothetical protein
MRIRTEDRWEGGGDGKGGRELKRTEEVEYSIR